MKLNVNIPFFSNYLPKEFPIFNLGVRTLFSGYRAFLSANNTADEKKCLKFLRSVIRKGAPEEALICGATLLVKNYDTESKSDLTLKNIQGICEDWNTNVHLALQFAVINYLTSNRNTETEDWYPIIKTLLKLDADPNYVSTKFEYMLRYSYRRPKTELKSAFAIAIFSYELTDKVYELVNDFATQQQKLKTKMIINLEQLSAIYPSICTKQTFIYDQWYQYLEKNFPEQALQYLLKYKNKIILACADNNDFDSIEHFRKQFGIDPFPILIEKEISRSDVSCVHSPVFQYLEKTFKERLLAYIKTNHDNFIHRFMLKNLVTENKTDTIDQLRKQYGIDPFDTFINRNSFDPQDPGFQYVEAKDFDRLKMYTNANLPNIMDHVAWTVGPRGDEDESKNMCENNLFLWLEKLNPSAIGDFFNHFDHHQHSHYHLKYLLRNRKAIEYLAYQYNIDIHIFKSTTFASYADLNSYFIERSQFVLDFICQQTFPKAATGFKAKELNHADKKIFVSVDLYSIVEALQKAINSSYNSQSLFGEIVNNLAPALAKEKPTNRDDVEHQIYIALASVLQDNSPLSKYVRREFHIKRDCLPLLKALKSEGSALHKVSKDPTFDKNVLGLVFRFMGDYGVKEQIDVELSEQLQESKEPKKEYAREVKFHF